ncbi:glycosyltransferase family 4 protein, partial [Bacteroidota bacterium]
IAVSNFVKRELVVAGYPEKIIKVIYNSIDSNLFDPSKFDKDKARKYFGLPLDRKIVAFPSRAIRPSTGKFGDQKNFITLARAAKHIKEKFGDNFLIIFPTAVGFKENIVAKEKTLREFGKFIEEEGVADNFFEIKRKIQFAEMPILYRASDVMCTPSKEEAFGLVFLEAMLMGVVPIGALSGGVPEIIDDGNTGFLIDAKDHRRLSEIIVELFTNDKKRIKMGKAARAAVIDKFSLEDMIKKIIETYKDATKTVKGGMP